MAEVYSTMSSKGQVVIPKGIRQELRLQKGDLVRFRVGENGTVTIDKALPFEDSPFAIFSEWASQEDERLYRDL